MATVHIIHDHDGKIIAASKSKILAKPAYTHGVTLDEGEFAVPTKFGGEKLHDYISHLVVDVSSRHLKEKGKVHK